MSRDHLTWIPLLSQNKRGKAKGSRTDRAPSYENSAEIDSGHMLSPPPNHIKRISYTAYFFLLKTKTNNSKKEKKLHIYMYRRKAHLVQRGYARCEKVQSRIFFSNILSKFTIIKFVSSTNFVVFFPIFSLVSIEYLMNKFS